MLRRFADSVEVSSAKARRKPPVFSVVDRGAFGASSTGIMSGTKLGGGASDMMSPLGGHNHNDNGSSMLGSSDKGYLGDSGLKQQQQQHGVLFSAAKKTVWFENAAPEESAGGGGSTASSPLLRTTLRSGGSGGTRDSGLATSALSTPVSDAGLLVPAAATSSSSQQGTPYFDGRLVSMYTL